MMKGAKLFPLRQWFRNIFSIGLRHNGFVLDELGLAVGYSIAELEHLFHSLIRTHGEIRFNLEMITDESKLALNGG